jgi:hypothetical protein
MVSFQDWDYVVIDDENKTVTIVLNNGTTREYKIKNQPELMNIINGGYENGEITIYDAKENDQDENTYDYNRDFWTEDPNADFGTWRW